MVLVRLPSMLRYGRSDALEIADDVRNVGELIEILARRVPGFRQQMDAAMLNIAINDDLVVHDLPARPLRDGDVIEIVPTISGGAGP
jgi:molybdopterin converting factor small subunit